MHFKKTQKKPAIQIIDLTKQQRKITKKDL